MIQFFKREQGNTMARIGKQTVKTRQRLNRKLKLLPVGKEFRWIKESEGIKEFKLLKNGLQLLLMEDHSAPVLTFMVTYRVGSRNEAIGYTGSTHLLEHLMFKGTPTFNREKGTSIFATLQNVGAMMNATTWNDRTNYFENLPSDQLELAVRIESDRMRNSWIRDEDRQPEMMVVRNEFERGENDPFTALHKQIWATAYQAHPYHHDTIGWRSDIENVPIEQLRQFYHTFYWPDNATVTIIGDFNEKEALRYIFKYFGPIKKSPQPFPPMYTAEPKQEGSRRFVVKRPGEVGIVAIAHKKPEGLHADQVAFDVLEQILIHGKTSRFYRALVDSGFASNIFIDNSAFRDPGLFTTYVFLTPSTKHEEVEKITLDEYRKITDGGVTSEEVEKAKAQIRTAKAFSRDGSYSIAGELNEAIAIGDWTYYTTYLDKVNHVLPDDISRIVKTYLVEDVSTTGYFIPLEGGTDLSSGGPVSYLLSLPGPSYYRKDRFGGSNPRGMDPAVPLPGFSGGSKSTGGPDLGSKIQDRKVAGIRVLSLKTGVKDVVTISGSMAGGDFYSPVNNRAIADLTGSMLDQGTTKRDRFQISSELEKVGAEIHFSVNTHSLNWSARCLRKDISLVIEILAEELRDPAFNEKILDILKKRRIASFKQALDKTESKAMSELTRQIFQKDHPNYEVPYEQLIEETEKISVSDLKNFHRLNYGYQSLVLVAVGDLDPDDVNHAVSRSFGGWIPGLDYRKILPAEKILSSPKPIVVHMKEKTSSDLVIGQSLGLTINDQDYLPLMLGTYILGGNFSARLMQTVRDQQGLTYGIGSQMDGHILSDGYWFIHGTFAPENLEKGYRSTVRECKRWIKKGITREELKNKKQTITGSYKVSLATTRGLAGRILGVVLRGYPMTYLDRYPAEINAVSLDQVNPVIKKYINDQYLFTIAAGTVDENLKPSI
jgi:zinc protease